MDKLVELSKEILNHMDNGDLMTCYSMFEANVRGLLEDFDQDDEFIKVWLTQRNNIDDEDWACLLYTSPSPRDRTRSRMPSSA